MSYIFTEIQEGNDFLTGTLTDNVKVGLKVNRQTGKTMFYDNVSQSYKELSTDAPTFLGNVQLSKDNPPSVLLDYLVKKNAKNGDVITILLNENLDENVYNTSITMDFILSVNGKGTYILNGYGYGADTVISKNLLKAYQGFVRVGAGGNLIQIDRMVDNIVPFTNSKVIWDTSTGTTPVDIPFNNIGLNAQDYINANIMVRGQVGTSLIYLTNFNLPLEPSGNVISAILTGSGGTGEGTQKRYILTFTFAFTADRFVMTDVNLYELKPTSTTDDTLHLTKITPTSGDNISVEMVTLVN